MKQNLLEKILRNTIIDFINEGRNAEKAKQNAYNVIKNYFKNASWLNDVFNDQAANPNRLTVLEYIEDSFRRDFFGTNVSDSVIRLEPIMMNVALGLGFEQNEADGEKLNRLKSIIQYIKLNNGKEGFPIQLNKLTIDNTSYEGLNKLFGEIIDNEIAKDNETANQYDKDSKIDSNYEVIEIHNQNEAYEYGQYSCSNSRLCFTTSKDMWEKFTNNGLNRSYLILNKNWKNIPEKFGENNPYDEYGLSMIFLFINPEGNIAYSNTRWNHGTKEHVSNVDNSFTKSDISKLLGVNFNSIFKPYSDEELMEKGYITISKIKELLSKGKKINEIFKYIDKLSEHLFLCTNDNEKFILYNSKNNKIPDSLDNWLDYVYNFQEGFAKIELNDKYSFIDTEGNLIGNGKLWFDWIDYFEHGFAPVELNGKETLFSSNGKLIGNGKLWFDKVLDSNNNFFKVELNKKFSLINSEGNLIGNGKLWFDTVSGFVDGFSKVKLNNKWSLIDSNGNLIGNGKLWFDDVDNFNNDFAVVKLNNKYSFIDTNGNLIGNGKLWFDKVYSFINGFAKVKLNDKCSLIDTEGNLIGNGKLWFDWVDNFQNGFATVELNDKCSLIDINGRLIGNGNAWFDLISGLINGFYIAFSSESNKWYVLNEKGELFDDGKAESLEIGDVNGNLLEVKINGKKYYIDTDFNLYDYNTKKLIKKQLNNESINRIGDVLRECINNYLNRKK